MSTHRLLELLVKRDSGILTLLEKKELTDLLKNNKDLDALMGAFDELSMEMPGLKEADEVHAEKNWNSLQAKMNADATVEQERAPVRKIKWRVPAIAATLLLVVLAAAIFIKLRAGKGSGEDSVFYTKKGSRSNMVLPDGTKVWLNADTRISYKKDFGEQLREVYLEGEAFFDVVKNPAVPFIVHTANMDVKVLGTAFDVKAYKEEAVAETALLRGAVEISLKNMGNKIIALKPSEKIVVPNRAANAGAGADEGEILITHVKKLSRDTAVLETLWTKDRLAFDHQRLETIAVQLERWYGVTIEIEGNQLKETRFSAAFSDENLEEVLEALKLTSDIRFTYQIDKNTIKIKSR